MPLETDWVIANRGTLVRVGDFIDAHIHVGPDECRRAQSARELAVEASRVNGWLVLKSHTVSTVPVAWDLRDEGLPVSGSVVLNGHIDDTIIDYIAALAHLNMSRGGKRLIVFLPTRLDQGLTHSALFDTPTSLSSLGGDVLRECTDLGVVVATGHTPREGIFPVVDAYTGAGGDRLLLTHATHPLVGLSTDDIVSLGQKSGVYVELTALTYTRERAALQDSLPVWEQCPRVIFSSDFGQPGNPTPSQWFSAAFSLLGSLPLTDQQRTRALCAVPGVLIT